MAANLQLVGDSGGRAPRSGVPVHIDANEPRITREAIMAILRRGGVYQRGGKIVEPRLIPTPKRYDKGQRVIREADSWQFTEVRNARMRALAAESCHFTKTNKQGKIVDANVPEWLPGAILSEIRWPFPVLKGLAESPTMRADGSIISKPGFDELTGIYLAPNDVVLSVPEHPTQEDARRAAELLLDVVCDFPFEPEEGRSVWLSGVLSSAARGAVDGPIPMHIMEASMRGSGKSRLVDAANIITSGRPAARMTNVETDEEMDKRIVALAIEGDETALIDNVIGDFGFPSLDAALTSTSYRGRILGKSEMTPHLPMQIVWWATGNGMVLSADLARRSIVGRLEPRTEHPEERTGPMPGAAWKHNPLLDYVRRERSALLSAALTIVKAYIDAGKPSMSLKPMDFPAWSDTIRSAIVWAGQKDPGATIKSAREADVRADAFRVLIESWPVRPNVPSSATDLVAYAAGLKSIPENSIESSLDGTTVNRWKTALVEWCPPSRNETDLPSPLSLGNKLRRMKGAVVGNFKLEAGARNEFGVTWKKVPL